MNEELRERWKSQPRGYEPTRERHMQVEVVFQPPKLNAKVREYYEARPATGGDWLLRSEIPGSAEIMDRENSSNSNGSSDIVELAANKPRGAFSSKEEYLHTHYELIREDALRPLREAVTAVRESPSLHEDGHNGKIGIYEKVHICGITLSTRGIASRITFSLHRTGKQIIWEQSKRLIAGSLVVLTPVDDMFQQKAIVATVAARPLAGLVQNPPEIDIFFQSGEVEVDPSLEYVMIEDRGGLYEAERHTLLALQHMMAEPFPLSEHLVGVQRTVSVPEDILKSPKTDMTSVIVNNKHDTFENLDVLKPWPKHLQSELDESQLSALCQILTKRLAIIQGPPGTGKTHVSVEAIRVMLANRTDKDPPIVLACQTNHAIDQMLRHILKFEENVARLGGRSKDPVVKKRTLYELRKTISENPPAGCLFGGAKLKMNKMTKEIAVLLSPLQPDKKPLNHHILADFKLISQAQADSLEAGASSWVQERLSNPNEARSPFLVWLGDKLITVPPKQLPENFGFEFEETDLEFEQLKEAEAENAVKDDDEFETLSGLPLPLADNFTCHKIPGEDAKAKEYLTKKDMWKIPEASRGAVYRHLQRAQKEHITALVRTKAKEFNSEAKKRQIGGWERDEPLLKTQKIIGMTTTGFSKYRGLISALGVKTILIEEAAETLEATVTVTCIPTLQQLILVGDHLQLRPHCHVKSHENDPWNLNISLFERLVMNEVEFRTLTKQRRMIPEIRRLLCPIYKEVITDHPSVTNPDDRPDVPGMGGVNSFFFTHAWSEQRDDFMSAVNPMEADMIVGFVEYLVYNGVSTEDITILTFYNGQRKRILSTLRRIISLSGSRFNVVTVDSYQGEENKVVLLSLVRSNENKQIGFLNVENRICVALSRAQCGFYVFGNGKLLFDTEADYRSTRINGIKHKAPKAMWTHVMKIFSGQKGKQHEKPDVQPSRLDIHLPLRCSKHNNITKVSEPEHFQDTYGGCKSLCGETLACGHSCQLPCHPFPHDQINCTACPQKTNSAIDNGPAFERGGPIHSYDRGDALHSQGTSPSRSSGSNASSWNSFSTQEPARVARAKKHAQATDLPLSRRSSPDQALTSATADLNRNFGGMGLDGTMSTNSSSKTNVAARTKFTDHRTATPTHTAKPATNTLANIAKLANTTPLTKLVNIPKVQYHAQMPSFETVGVKQKEVVKEVAKEVVEKVVAQEEEKLIDFDD